jgi:hypothetical protein
VGVVPSSGGVLAGTDWHDPEINAASGESLRHWNRGPTDRGTHQCEEAHDKAVTAPYILQAPTVRRHMPHTWAILCPHALPIITVHRHPWELRALANTDAQHYVLNITSLPRGQLEQFLNTYHEALHLGEPGTDLLFLKSDQVLIVSLLSALEEVSI